MQVIPIGAAVDLLLIYLGVKHHYEPAADGFNAYLRKDLELPETVK
jgi:hypothetical protein